ncbi:MAG: DeoR/GlpR transcriptional regulator [Oscillospiraceae bacterium]|nr:DeoR/GlpR transcriptional regulator [Oscillospiraceae bacterium]
MRAKRIDAINEYVKEKQSVSLQQLCKEFHVSLNTIRRDIAFLIEQGEIEKVYGGVVSKANSKSHSLSVQPFYERNIVNTDAKENIAKAAADFVEDNDTIFLDSGTTTIQMVKYLEKYNNLTVVTYCIPIIAELYKLSDIRVISLPGYLLRDTCSLVGETACDFLNGLNINKAFMASTGVTSDFNVTNATFEECGIKKTALKQSRTHYLLVDNSKFGQSGIMSYARLNQFDAVISNAGIPDTMLKYINENNIQFCVR